MTRWTLVQSTQSGDTGEASRALGELCEQYWFPLYSFVRRSGKSPEDAEDLTQAFFHRVLERHYFSEADVNRGRLRSFLLAALKHFLADEWDRATAQKRGGGKTVVSIDEARAEERYGVEPVDHLSPDVVYEKQWAMTVMEQALGQLAAEQAEAGKAELFERIKGFLSGQSDRGDTHARAAEELGLSESNVRVTVFRLRKRYGDLVRAAIAETVTDPADVASEMQHLFEVLRGD